MPTLELMKANPGLRGFPPSALVSLGILASVGILAQCGWAAAAISRGAPMDRVAWLFFALDILALGMTMIATALAASQRPLAQRIAFVLACLCSISPLYHAVHVALHGHIRVWLVAFDEQFQDTAYRFGLSFLPALFSLTFAYMLYRRLHQFRS